MAEARTAAFVRVEGALVSRGALGAAAYFAANASGFAERALRLGHVALATPVYRFLGQNDRVLANRLAYVGLRGMTEDRIAVLAEEYFHGLLSERVLEGGRELLRRARKDGQQVVLISDGLDQVVRLLAEQLRNVDHVLCNRLEFRDGLATGKLLDPVVGGHDLGRWVRRYAEEQALELSGCRAYAAHGPDLLMMSEVGQPCAVNPDFTLRRAAREADWPVLDYDV
jgi:phosphoserine phosphatase